MARIARVIAAGIPHHITQRGNRRMQTFFGDDDYRAYITLLVQKMSGGDLGVLPHAESCAPDRRSGH